MIERVARAMFIQDHDESWEDGEDLTKEIYLGNARAAIAALSEMADEHICGPQGCWAHQLDAALEPASVKRDSET